MKQLILATLLAVLVGCSFHPLGIDDAQWQQMTVEQRQQAYMEQAKLDEAAREHRAAQLQEQMRLQEQALQLRQQQLEQAGPGDLVQCTLEKAQADYGKNKWRAAQPLAVEMLKGDVLQSDLERVKRSYQRIAVRLSFDGMRVQLCDNYNSCASMVATSGELRRGKRSQVSTRKVRGRLFCQYPSPLHYF